MRKLGLILILSITLLFTGCSKDSAKFKQEYENVNGDTTSNGRVIRSLNIPSNNPMVYATVDDIITKMEKKETFIVYFGFATCPWCRSIINNLIDVANDMDINKIYYVDILNIRDVIVLENDKEVVKTKADDSYYKLLTLLDDVLDNYTLTDSNGNKKISQEKRIYAPNIVAIKDGKAISMTTGVSDKLTDAYMDLTDEINDESYQMIKETLKKTDSCSELMC